ncbi:MAG: iron-containing alcohol dehydrogenase, partial [Burkholderiales bacterium]|nr:iron-containing alcohol dehydrogenase [Burkholderiales bacterium]
RLAQLARDVGLEGDDDAALAERFVAALLELADGVGIPRTVAALRDEDIAALALAACREADLNYPVPRQMTPADAEALLRAVLPAPAGKAPRRRAAAASGSSAATAQKKVPRRSRAPS